MPFGSTDVISLHSDHRHVSAAHVTIFRVVSVQEYRFIYSVSESLQISNHIKVKQSRYRPGVAQRVPGS
jgi:outer membrane lipopolysaccharide assembly protein LptE/RlpB